MVSDTLNAKWAQSSIVWEDGARRHGTQAYRKLSLNSPRFSRKSIKFSLTWGLKVRLAVKNRVKRSRTRRVIVQGGLSPGR